jgi:multidrug efflux pump subunit AcrB
VERFIDRFYVPLVKAAINQRWITISISVAVLIATIGLMTSGRLKMIFFPEEESDWIIVDAELPFGVPIDQTEEVMKRIVEAAHKTIEENGGDSINRGTLASVGKSGTHTTTIRTALVPSNQRSISSHEFASQWRKNLGEIPNMKSLTFDSSTGLSSKPVDFELSHEEPEILESAAKQLASELESFSGLRDIENGIQLGKAQLDFTVSTEGESAGLTSSDLARQVRSAFFGAEALRQQRGRDEIRVMVRLPRNERESLVHVEEMVINTPSGGEMTLRKAADITPGRAYTAIHRVNGKRIARVKAAITSKKVDANKVESKVLENVLPKIAADYPGLTFEPAGMRKNLDEFFEFLLVGFLLALMFNYCLIAIPLKSYIQPLSVVMIAIPFGFIGAILGHLFFGMNLSIMSWIGIVALSGVVVNDSIVYVDSANRLRRQGLDPFDAAVNAARRRFRPIVLTSLTTFVGLTPIISETSVQANMVKPMAVSLGFGILFSTFFILLLVPTLFMLTEMLRIWNEKRRELLAGDNIDAAGQEKQPLAKKIV